MKAEHLRRLVRQLDWSATGQHDWGSAAGVLSRMPETGVLSGRLGEPGMLSRRLGEPGKQETTEAYSEETAAA